MTDVPVLGADDVAALLPMADAIDVLRGALADGRAPGEPVPRIVTPTAAGGQLLTMPAVGPDGIGVKAATIAPAGRTPRIQAMYLLFDPDSHAPTAVIDGTALTELRTPAVSALAADVLAPAQAHRLVVFGTGPQAFGHVRAMAAIRPIDDVAIVGRSRAAAEVLVRQIEERLDLSVRAASASVVDSADIVCTCTSSAVPVFDGTLLAPDVHLSAIGSHQPDVRELDDAALRGSRIVVESRQSAFAEKGDLVMAVASGAVGKSDVVADLAQLVRAEITVTRTGRSAFLSAGMAWQDLVVAAALAARHRHTTR